MRMKEEIQSHNSCPYQSVVWAPREFHELVQMLRLWSECRARSKSDRNTSIELERFLFFTIEGQDRWLVFYGLRHWYSLLPSPSKEWGWLPLLHSFNCWQVPGLGSWQNLFCFTWIRSLLDKLIDSWNSGRCLIAYWILGLLDYLICIFILWFTELQ